MSAAALENLPAWRNHEAQGSRISNSHPKGIYVLLLLPEFGVQGGR